MRKAGPQVLLAGAIALLLSGCAEGATIERHSGSPPIIVLTGKLNDGDEKAFVTEMLQVDGEAVVVFDGPGGSLYAGIEIGKAIRLKGFATLVLDGSTCASACAFAWLGGVVRMMEPGARIGFHAAYELEGGTPRERGAPNALVGAYLGGLGLPQRAIYFATDSPPEGMSWLTPEIAREVGIDVREFQSASQPEQQVQLPQEPPQTITPATPTTDPARVLQLELKRVGCYGGPIDGILGPQSVQAFRDFTSRAFGKIYPEATIASAIEAVRAVQEPVCSEPAGTCAWHDGKPHTVNGVEVCTADEVRRAKELMSVQDCYTHDGLRFCRAPNFSD